MALKDILTFYHMPVSDQISIPVASGSAISGTPFLYQTDGSTNQCLAASIDDANGRWYRQSVFTPASGTISKSLSLFWPVGTIYGMQSGDVWYIGMRTKIKNLTGAGTSWLANGRYVSLVNTTTGTIVTNNLTGCVTVADLGWTMSSDMEVYVELRLDFVNNKVKVWVDSVPVRELAISNVAAWLAAGSILVGSGTVSSQVAAATADIWIRDAYVKKVDNVNDDFRLGPQLLDLMTISAASATNWTVTGGAADLKAALNTPVTTTEASALVAAVSDQAKNPLTATFAPVHKTSKINAALYQFTAARQSGSSGVLYSKLTDGTNSTAELNTYLQTSQTPQQGRTLLEKALDGTNLTETKVAATQMVLRPAAT